MVDLRAVAERVVAERVAPCAVVAAAIYQGSAFRTGAGASGRLTWDEAAPCVTLDTPFDLASVTKPLTALTLARMARAGLVARSDGLSAVLPALRSTRSARATLDLLSAHRAGLEGHRPLYAPLLTGATVDLGEALVAAADARRADCEGDPPAEGFAPVYSDLGDLLLGAALAARGGDELDSVVAREVTEPLGLSLGSARQLRAADSSFDERVAPTEVVAFRGGLVRGAVHDENAWALSGHGFAGHAGLFGDARSVLGLGIAILEALMGRRRGWLRPEDLEPLLRARQGGSHLAGFDRRSGEAPSSGALFGPRTFGHLGFTGTSLWVDPDRALVGVLLTNRVHPSRESIAIRQARPIAYDAMARAMLA